MKSRQNISDVSPAKRPTLCAWIFITIILAHLGLFIYGSFNPEAILRYDRSKSRFAVAEELANARDFDAFLNTATNNGIIGDYAWHSLVLWATNGWLHWSIAVPLFQLALWALSLLALYRLVENLDDRPQVAWIAVILYGLIPVDIMIPHFLASEAIFTPLLIGAMSFLVRYARKTSSPKDLCWAGLLLSLALITRFELVIWVLPVIAIMFLISLASCGGKVWLHMPLFCVCIFLFPILWMSFQGARTGHFGYGRSGPNLALTIQIRVEEIHQIHSVKDSLERQQARTFGEFFRSFQSHPKTFLKSWLFHSMKFLIFPDNLDISGYLGLHHRTGARSRLVHQVGWAKALTYVIREMPILTTWLLTTMVLFAFFWVLVFRGVFLTLRFSHGAHRLTYLLLLSLPFVYLAMRVISEGNSRKRSPVDFVLVVFAAIAFQAMLTKWRQRRSAAA